jgi:hypothetical protein
MKLLVPVLPHAVPVPEKKINHLCNVWERMNESLTRKSALNTIDSKI